jgi:hypothetical protein
LKSIPTAKILKEERKQKGKRKKEKKRDIKCWNIYKNAYF